MPIRAYCTICSDFFDNARDVAAITCGHTFHQECLLQWFHSAPHRTCPQCRIQVSSRQIISKLFFDIGGEEETVLDAESLKNEVDRIKASLLVKEKEKRECQGLVDSLREMLDVRNVTIQSQQKELGDMEMLCSTLKKQIKFLDKQQSETKAAKDEARKLRNKLKTMESIEVLLQSQRSEVEEMIRDMGSGQAAVEQLAIYCVSLKKEYENLKEVRKSSAEMTEKLRKELFSSNHKAQKAELELTKVREELSASQKELHSADKEIMSLKKKVEFLQKTLTTPTASNEAISRLIFESPAPIGLERPKLRPPMMGNDINLDVTFDIDTPEHNPQKSVVAPFKKMKFDNKERTSRFTCWSPFQPISSRIQEKKFRTYFLFYDSENRKHPLSSPTKNPLQESKGLMSWAGGRTGADEDEDLTLPSFIKNSLLHKKPVGSLLGLRQNTGAVRTGFDGLGGRTKFIQPSNLTEIRPLHQKMKRKKVSRPTACTSSLANQPRLEDFLK